MVMGLENRGAEPLSGRKMILKAYHGRLRVLRPWLLRTDGVYSYYTMNASIMHIRAGNIERTHIMYYCVNVLMNVNIRIGTTRATVVRFSSLNC